MAQRSSTGDTHPYLQGYRFWSKNMFWETEMHSEKAKEYHRKWLNNLQKREPKFSTLSDVAR